MEKVLTYSLLRRAFHVEAAPCGTRPILIFLDAVPSNCVKFVEKIAADDGDVHEMSNLPHFGADWHWTVEYAKVCCRFAAM